MATDTPKTRPGGRTERNRTAVYAAVIEAMKEEGVGFTYQDVADRSGVSRRTLHRRWPGRADLIAESLRADYDRFDVPLTGRLDVDLREFALKFRDFAAHPTIVMIDGLAALSSDPDLARLSRTAFEESTAPMMAALLDAPGAAQLEPETDAETIISMLVSPIVVACSILRKPPTDEEVDRLVDHVLRAASRRY